MTFPYEEVSHLVGQIGEIGYGQARCFEARLWHKAIPTVDPMSQLALAAAGRRPETEREPLDWVRFWVNGTDDADFMKVKHEPFDVSEDPVTGNLIVRLPSRFCPQCGGRGVVREFGDIPANVDLTTSDEIVVTTKPCTHDKRPTDRTRVSWP